MRLAFFYLLLCVHAFASESQMQKPIALFNPPLQWQFAKPKNGSAHVQVGFVGSSTHFFHPSINLATEEFNGTLKEYLKAVKVVHLAEPNTTWRDLGKFVMKGGEGRLTEINYPSAFGEVKMLQAILVERGTAYILTAAILKSEFATSQKEILESLQSLCFYPDLFSALPDPEQKMKLEQLFADFGQPHEEEKKKEQWEMLQKEVVQECSNMGSHWQYLVLKEGRDIIFSHLPELTNGAR